MADAKPPFEDVYRDYLSRIYAYVRAQVGGASEAEDVTSQVFLKAYQAYPRFEAQGGSHAAWLFTIARNAILDLHRRGQTRSRVERALAAEPEPFEDPAEAAEARLRRRELAEAVAALPERQRQVITLRHASGLSFREIGRLMDCSEDAAKMLHHRGLRALREPLEAGR